MGDKNQLNWVKKNADIVLGPILEVGSKDYGHTPDYRSLFPNFEYIGVDIAEGKGVDCVLNLMDEFKSINEKLGRKKFKTAICNSLLEHCLNPFKVSHNLELLLDQDGIVFVSVPFAWRIHGYPSDYWRFTSEAVKVLFPQVEFFEDRSNMSSWKIGEVAPIDNFMFKIESVSGYREVFPEVIINMVGRKKKWQK